MHALTVALLLIGPPCKAARADAVLRPVGQLFATADRGVEAEVRFVGTRRQPLAKVTKHLFGKPGNLWIRLGALGALLRERDLNTIE